jgi:pectate lyase
MRSLRTVPALGRNGTTRGGRRHSDRHRHRAVPAVPRHGGPLVIPVPGTVDITGKQGVRPDKTLIGVGSSALVNGGGSDLHRSYNVIVRNNASTGSGTCETDGTVAEPHTTSSCTPAPAADVPVLVRAGAGAGKIGASAPHDPQERP